VGPGHRRRPGLNGANQNFARFARGLRSRLKLVRTKPGYRQKYFEAIRRQLGVAHGMLDAVGIISELKHLLGVTSKRNEHVAENDYFDACHIRDRAGDGSGGQPGQGDDGQQQGYKA
jgi:hypothetical protein